MSNFFRDLTENVAGFLKFMITLAVIVVIVLLVRGGALQRLGIRAGVPSISGPSPGLGPKQEALANALRGAGVEAIYGTPQGANIKLTLSWPQTMGTGKGAQIMAQAKTQGYFRSYAPESMNNIDVRNNNGRAMYIGKFLVMF